VLELLDEPTSADELVTVIVPVPLQLAPTGSPAIPDSEVVGVGCGRR
jgi:hypothetical protein